MKNGKFRLTFWGSATLTLVAALFLGGAGLSRGADGAKSDPYDRIAPLINDETVSVTRINLDQLDLDRVAETIQGQFVDYLTKLRFDAESTARTEKELNVTLSRLTAMGKGFLNDFRKKTKITEVWLILSRTGDEDEPLAFCLALPFDDRSEEETAALEGFVTPLDMTIHRLGDSFLIVTMNQDETPFAYYEKLTPKEIPFLRDALAAGADATVSTVIVPFDLAGIVRGAGGPDLMEEAKKSPVPILPLITVFKDSFAGASFHADLNRLTAAGRVDFTDEKSAVAVGAELEKLIDSGITVLRKQMEEEMADNNPQQAALFQAFNLVSLGTEYGRGLGRTLFPVPEKNSLVFSETPILAGSPNSASRSPELPSVSFSPPFRRPMRRPVG